MKMLWRVVVEKNKSHMDKMMLYVLQISHLIYLMEICIYLPSPAPFLYIKSLDKYVGKHDFCWNSQTKNFFVFR